MSFPQVKQKENGLALKCFQSVTRSLDSLGWEERQLALVKGLLAGNVFDWGAKAVSDVLESDPQFGFEEAKRKLQERPWLVDSYTKWLQRLKVCKVPLHLPLGVGAQSLDLAREGGHQSHWAYGDMGVTHTAHSHGLGHRYNL